MKKLFASLSLLVFALQSCPVHLLAQDNDDEEVFELSPFTVEANERRGYRSQQSLSGSRLKTDLKDVSSAVNAIDASFFQDSGASIVDITDANQAQLAYAHGVIVRFAVGFYDDQEEKRRKALVEHLNKIQTEIAKDAALHYTPGALRIAKGDRKKFRNKPKSHFTSYAHFALSFNLSDGLSPLKRVASVRQLIADLQLDSDVTKIYYGEALLLTDSPFATPAYNSPISPLFRSARAASDLGASVPYLVDARGQALRESIPLCSTTLIKPADKIRLQFAFDTQSKGEEKRIQSLNSAMENVRAIVEANPELSFTPGSILLRHGDNQGKHSKSPHAFTSQAQFWIEFSNKDEIDSAQQILALRNLIRTLDIPQEISKVHYGPASLVLETPQEFHSEILTAIFADLDMLQSQIGERYEVVPLLKHKRVHQRRHSQTEVEVWIPYDYKIESIAERERLEKAKMLEHERALAANQASAHRCHRCSSPEPKRQ